MNQTPNYNLNQWDAADRVQRTDFNADNAKIDAALAALASGKADVSALTALAAGLPQFALGSYVGNGRCGSANPVTLTFPFNPDVVLVSGGGTTMTMFAPYTSYRYKNVSKNSDWTLTWGDKSLSWYGQRAYSASGANETMVPAYQYNDADTTYRYIALKFPK